MTPISADPIRTSPSFDETIDERLDHDHDAGRSPGTASAAGTHLAGQRPDRALHPRPLRVVRAVAWRSRRSRSISPATRSPRLIGPSGCGKSTLLRCFNRMNDLITGARMQGEVRFDGDLISGADIDPVVLRRRIGMVFQKPNPFSKSIYNNVAWGARINGYRGNMDELVERSLRRAALWDEVKTKLNRSGLELSGGQQQRLCIARTLAVEPEVILMDEPCSALDPISTARVEDLMDDLKNDYTIVIVTHNMQQARRVSDMTACLMLDEGSRRTPNRHPRRVQPDRSPLHQPQGQAHRGVYHRADRLTLTLIEAPMHDPRHSPAA